MLQGLEVLGQCYSLGIEGWFAHRPAPRARGGSGGITPSAWGRSTSRRRWWPACRRLQTGRRGDREVRVQEERADPGAPRDPGPAALALASRDSCGSRSDSTFRRIASTRSPLSMTPSAWVPQGAHTVQVCTGRPAMVPRRRPSTRWSRRSSASSGETDADMKSPSRRSSASLCCVLLRPPPVGSSPHRPILRAKPSLKRVRSIFKSPETM